MLRFWMDRGKQWAYIGCFGGGVPMAIPYESPVICRWGMGSTRSYTRERGQNAGPLQ